MGINKYTNLVDDCIKFKSIKICFKSCYNLMKRAIANSSFMKLVHNTKFMIIIFIYFFIVSTAILVCTFSILRSDEALFDTQKNGLIQTAKAEARKEEQILLKGEKALFALANFIELTFDINKIDDLNYVKYYRNNVMTPATKHYFDSTTDVYGMYSYLDVMRINPEKYVAESWVTKNKFTEEEAFDPLSYTKDDMTMCWYYKVFKSQKDEWIEPYWDVDLKKNIVSYAIPIYKNKNNKATSFIGAVGLDLTSDNLKKNIDKFKINKTGYAFLVTKDYHFIANKNYSINDQLFKVNNGYYKPLLAKIKNKDSGIIKLNKDVIAFSKMYNGYIWFLSVPESEVFAPIYSLNILLVVFTFISVLIATAIMLILLKYLSKLVDTLIMSDKIIMTIANSIEAKDVYTKGHVQRVTAYALKVGEYFNLSVTEMKELKTASLLHDIGKIGVPDEILNKPGKLTNEEFEVMKNHTVFGSKILQPLSGFTHLVGMVRNHHEKLDGSGYPDGLKGEDIYITTRILTVIDIYDALITERPYKKAFTKEVALQILEEDVEKGYLDRRVFETFKYVLENYKTVGEFSSFRLVKKTK